ncbi:hypothetical protein INT43_001349 [Umbelopsis isabellina]|uniref:histidine kinase n=1 Tax=Mortierella isabellina TaxID=91625 RepID=A0A8H7UBQ1_MORIS|nr:hypothetical protein INT43_001349 [Umbelopsis isabellina]
MQQGPSTVNVSNMSDQHHDPDGTTQHIRKSSSSSDPLLYARSASQYHAKLYNDHQQRSTSSDERQSPPQLPPFQNVMLSFEPPNLYKTALQLSSEIDLQNWWYSVVDVLSNSSFHASRACLSLPQDPSEPYHSAWGVKAVHSRAEFPDSAESDSVDSTNNEHSDDYFTKTERKSVDLTDASQEEEKPNIPTLPLCFESLQPFDRDEEPLIDKNSIDRIIRRGTTVVLSREYRHNQSSDPLQVGESSQQIGSGMFKRTLMERLDSYHHHHQLHHQQNAPPGAQMQQQNIERNRNEINSTSRRHSAMSTLPQTPTFDLACLNLQASDDNCKFGDSEVLPHSDSSGAESTLNTQTGLQPNVDLKRDYVFDEYEQQQPSPWSQSPAPSPAMMDPNVNPFFTTALTIDDDAFNPTSPESYESSNVSYPMPVGNVHSIVHIPIYHQTGRRNSGKSLHAEAPFAILSFLSAVVPYPQVMISCINSLVPFIATSLSNCLAHQTLSRQAFYYRHQDSGHAATSTSTDSPSKKLTQNISPESASSNPLSPEHARQYTATDTDSATPTPTANGAYDKRGPFSAGGMAMLHKNAFEAIDESKAPADDTPPNYDLDYDNNTKSIVQMTPSCEQPSFLPAHINTKDESPTSKSGDHDTNSSAHPYSPTSSRSASPLSSAIRHGWDAISPTTGLPIIASIPPSSIDKWRRLSSSSSAYESDVGVMSTAESKSPGSVQSPGSVKSVKSSSTLSPSSIRSPASIKSPATLSPSSIKSSHSCISPSPGISPTLQVKGQTALPATPDIPTINEDTAMPPPSGEDDTLAGDEADEPPDKPRNKIKRKQYAPHGVPSVPSTVEGGPPPEENTIQLSEKSSSKEHKRDTMIMPRSRLLRLIIDGIPIHVFRVMQYSGLGMKDHVGSRWLSHMHPDDRAACKRQWKAAFEDGVGFAGQYRLRRFDGDYRHFLWRTVPLRDTKGQIINWFGTCTDIHDEQIAKEYTIRQMETEHNERKYRLLAETIPQLVFTFSPEFGITYANQKWESYSGQPLEDTKGLAFMEQVHAEDRYKLRLPDLPDEGDVGVSWQEEVRLRSKDDEYRWFLIKCISVQQNEIPDARWFGTGTDINDQKLFEQKLKEAHDAAQKSTESKTRFLSNMSHEIRTPLIGITGMINFMLDSDLTAEQLDYAHTIQQSAESLLVVINDILDLSKVEAGMMKLEMEPFSLLGMVEDANELLSTLAIQKGLEMSFWVDQEVPDVVVGDRIRLRQVLLNLIGNAIKFTSAGEVFTKCSIHQPVNDSNEIMLMFEVVDTGSGFDSEGEAVMFKPFSQIDTSSTRKHGGSGLGLVISRQLIELHGGTVKCSSQKGEGSTFYFTVKFTIPSNTTEPKPQTPQEETIKSPFFRSSAYSVNAQSGGSHQPFHQPSSSFENPSSFGTSSPLEHSIKHSQLDGLTSASRLQEALLYKNAPPGGLLPVGVQMNPEVTSDFAGAIKKRDLALKISKELQLPKAFRTSAEDIPQAIEESEGEPTIVVHPAAPICPRALVISEWLYSKNVVVEHVKTLLQDKYNDATQLDVCNSHVEALQMLTDPDTKPYTWIIINLSMQHHILPLVRHIACSPVHQDAISIVLTTHLQRTTIFDGAANENGLFKKCEFIFKPLKRSKIDMLFPSPNEPVRQPSLSGTLLSQMTPRRHVPSVQQQTVAGQQEVFRRMLADVGNRGYHVLLVEDNLVNQKVMIRYLQRVGLEVDIAADGCQCVDTVMSHPHGYYALILCDLFMPVKDGYEATHEIRQWEASLNPRQPPIPIVALSANVMSDVATKCKEVGFSHYISKPVNFTTLSQVVRGYIKEYESNQAHKNKQAA